jgi:predicted transcriptional regulator
MKIPHKTDHSAYIKYIDENNRKNFEYVMELKDKVENLASLVSSHFMQYFDNYVLGIELQLLLLELFDSETPLPEQIGKPIPEKIKATQELLKRMSSFTIKERPTPKEAYDIMTEIISQKGGRRKTVRRNRHRRKTQHKKRKQQMRC